MMQADGFALARKDAGGTKDSQAVDIDSSPATSADHAELDTGLARRADCATEVLPWLERCDREHVVALRAQTLLREDRIDAVRDHTKALGRDAKSSKVRFPPNLEPAGLRRLPGLAGKSPTTPVTPMLSWPVEPATE